MLVDACKQSNTACVKILDETYILSAHIILERTRKFMRHITDAVFGQGSHPPDMLGWALLG